VNAWAKTAAAGLLLASSGIAAAQEPPSVAKDLTTVITLLGLPCGEVVKVEPKGENDNVATCKDGHRYRVYVNADGRVVAEKG
jgi:hypothetical protein